MDLGIKGFRNYELFKLVIRILGKFSKSPGAHNRINALRE
jgi:hypothetical protein